MVLNPSLFFNSKKRTIKFHFDMWHGDGNLDKAIQSDNDERNDLNNSLSPNLFNLIICLFVAQIF